jgi:hypothetical protein
MVKIGDDFIEQLLDTLDEAEMKLEKAYHAGDSAGFNGAKRTILLIQKKIGGLVR